MNRRYTGGDGPLLLERVDETGHSITGSFVISKPPGGVKKF